MFREKKLEEEIQEEEKSAASVAELQASPGEADEEEAVAPGVKVVGILYKFSSCICPGCGEHPWSHHSTKM